MNSPDRRSFLKLIGAPALAAAVPLNLSRLLAIQAIRAGHRARRVYITPQTTVARSGRVRLEELVARTDVGMVRPCDHRR